MEQIKQWIASLLITCVVSAIVMYFSSSSSLSRGVRVVTSLCISMVFVLPFAERKLFTKSYNNYSYQFANNEYPLYFLALI